MINFGEIIVILLIHWIADFIIQTDWQAKNKSKNNLALISHICSYTGIWAFTVGFYICITWNLYMILFIPITFICHLITDYYTSRLNSRLYSKGNIHSFFVSIGFDQILHYIQLFGIYLILK